MPRTAISTIRTPPHRISGFYGTVAALSLNAPAPPRCGALIQTLRGTEDMLLWGHRIETGLSTEANYGRFYPSYARPTNRWIRKARGAEGRTPGRIAQPLPIGVAPPDFALVTPPLQGHGGVLQAPWAPPVVVETRRTMLDPRGAAEKF